MADGDRETFDGEAFDREAVVAALEGLDQADDAAALAAARQAAALITAAGLDWDQVIAPPAGTEEPAEPEPTPAAADSSDGDDDKALIGRLLAIKTLYEGTRHELEGYLEDIDAGEFTAADSRYLKALYKRIAKQRKL